METVFASDIADSYLEFRKDLTLLPNESDREAGARIGHAYDALRVGQGSASGEKLTVLIRAATQASFYSSTDCFAAEALDMLKGLSSKGLATDQEYLRVYNETVHHRMFDDARWIAQHHWVEGAMEPLPKISRPPRAYVGPTKLEIGANQSVVTRQPMVLPKNGILVIAHPTCHFSQDAVRDIRNNPDLYPVFRDHAVWLAPAGARFELDKFAAWNSAHPDAALSIAYRQRELPTVDSWSTPIFYFFRGGQLYKKIVGWGGTPGEIDEIKAALRVQRLIADEITPRMSQAPTETTQASSEAPTQTGPVERSTAAIKSKRDLDDHLHRVPMAESPFRYLSTLDQQIFTSEARFDDGGLTLFPPDVFEGLTASQASELLSLFGWQFIVPDLPGIRQDQNHQN